MDLKLFFGLYLFHRGKIYTHLILSKGQREVLCSMQRFVNLSEHIWFSQLGIRGWIVVISIRTLFITVCLNFDLFSASNFLALCFCIYRWICLSPILSISRSSSCTLHLFDFCMDCTHNFKFWTWMYLLSIRLNLTTNRRCHR